MFSLLVHFVFTDIGDRVPGHLKGGGPVPVLHGGPIPLLVVGGGGGPIPGRRDVDDPVLILLDDGPIPVLLAGTVDAVTPPLGALGGDPWPLNRGEYMQLKIDMCYL